MLRNPETSQIDIALNTNVSKSMVSYVARTLMARGVVSQFGKERMKLQEPLRLLEALAFERACFGKSMGFGMYGKMSTDTTERMTESALTT